MGIRLARPRFVVPGGLNASMQLPPPFEFVGVTIRAFPLRAKLHVLQRFCDSYVNAIPAEAGYFRPFVPYVYLLVVNYGRMAVEAANLGWLSQHEIVFTIPCEWYREVDGRLVFHDWAFISPFIFVDNELSMTTGRQVYGWPKTMVWLDPQLSGWMASPRMPVRMAKISAMVFSDAFAGRSQEPRVMLELAHEPPLGQVSPVSSMLQGAALARDFAVALREVGMLRERPGETLDNLGLRLQRMAGLLDPFGNNVSVNAINLKQFRSAGVADYACYQAVTNSTMDLRRINDGGLLGAPGMLLGDASGGYDVIIHRYETVPIVENLGLEVDREWRGDGVNVARLKPVFPFWIDVDVRYGLGDTLAWRAGATGWTDERGHAFRRVKEEPEGSQPRYIGVSGASQEIAGPFQMPKTTMRVLPLVARRETLQQVIDDILNRPLAERDHDTDPLDARERQFEVWGHHVYLVASNHEEVASDANNLGWWADRDVTFYIPVKWYRNGRFYSVALFPVFSYANTATAAITGSEVSGIPMLKVEITSPPSTWMDGAGPSLAKGQPYVRMTSLVFPSAAGDGMGARERAILEVNEGQVFGEHRVDAWQQIAETWGRTLKRDLAASRHAGDPPARLETARTMALEVLANGRPINVLTLKQFRDVHDPKSACYQSIVLLERKIEQIFDIREIEAPLYVSIYDYASQPIVSTLGLVTKAVRQVEDGRAHMLQPVRPFWLKVSMREELGQTVEARAGAHPWQHFPLVSNDGRPDYFDPRDVAMWETPHNGDQVEATPTGEVGAAATDPSVSGRRLGVALDRHIHEHAPVRLTWQTQEWQATKDDDVVSVASAVEAVEAIPPQVVIESILSREWESRGATRWAAAQREIERCLDEATRGLLPHAMPERVVSILRAKVRGVQREPGHEAGEDLTQLLGISTDTTPATTRVLPLWERIAIDERFARLEIAAKTLARLEHGAYLLRMANDPSESLEAKRLFARRALEIFTQDELLDLLLRALQDTGVDVGGILSEAGSEAPPRNPPEVPPLEAARLAEAADELELVMAPGLLATAAQRLAPLGLDLARCLSVLGCSTKVPRGAKQVPFGELAIALRNSGLALDDVCLNQLQGHLQERGVDLAPIVSWVREAKLDVGHVDLAALLVRWHPTIDLAAVLQGIAEIGDAELAAFVEALSAILADPDLQLTDAPTGGHEWAKKLMELGIDTVGDVQKSLPYAVVDGRLQTGFDRAEVVRKSSAAAVTAAETAYLASVEGVVMWLAKAEQKPEFCVPCNSVLGAVQQALFPPAERWRDTWYVGPSLTE